MDPLTVLNLNTRNYIETCDNKFSRSTGVVPIKIIERGRADTEIILQGFFEKVSEPSYFGPGVTADSPIKSVFVT